MDRYLFKPAMVALWRIQDVIRAERQRATRNAPLVRRAVKARQQTCRLFMTDDPDKQRDLIGEIADFLRDVQSDNVARNLVQHTL